MGNDQNGGVPENGGDPPRENPPKWPSGAPSALSVNLSKKCAFSRILKNGQKSRWLSVNLLKNEEKSRGAISGTAPPPDKKKFPEISKNVRKFPGDFPEILPKIPPSVKCYSVRNIFYKCKFGGIFGENFRKFWQKSQNSGIFDHFWSIFRPFLTVF